MESGRRKTLVPSLLFLLILIISLSNQSLILNATIITKCHFPAIFNFGDSNSDTGGLSAAFGQAPPPNGETFFHRPAARYSDGRLLIDFIAQRVGLAYLGAYLDALGSNFTAGANFATGGSTIRPQNTSRHQSGLSPFSLNVQSYQFNDFHLRTQIIRKADGVFKELLPKTEAFSHGLYTFDIGQNDLTGGLLLNLSIDQVKASVPDILGQFKTVVKDVYDKEGGRSFWIHNTGPIGCLPYVLEHLPIRAGQMDINGCANPFNELAQFFNRRLKELVGQLRKELPEAAITYVDIYKARYALISQASKYGFDHPLRACCGYGGKYNYNTHIGCGGKVENKGKEILVGKSCEDPSVKIIWDGIHYTEAANKWVFDRIVNGSFSDPSVPLQMACHRK
ncbi:GDSL esterase/lipase At3g26430-like [Cynara cardunculus var. scolymus]|uniref:GDSL esterase/lipase At3g26430-like n=1 Tax=Cynara cardunculus var. scolymus TaxID=59895 RepID=UPI000D624A33|nr:GDSL esterase/lipase At3g26430-like [Cynara cardunculus var. scolymus]